MSTPDNTTPSKRHTSKENKSFNQSTNKKQSTTTTAAAAVAGGGGSSSNNSNSNKYKYKVDKFYSDDSNYDSDSDIDHQSSHTNHDIEQQQQQHGSSSLPSIKPYADEHRIDIPINNTYNCMLMTIFNLSTVLCIPINILLCYIYMFNTAFGSYQDDPTELSIDSTIDTLDNLSCITSNTIKMTGDAQYIHNWLLHHGFNMKTVNLLDGYNSIDLCQLSRHDCIDLLGTQGGIRLYNRIQQSIRINKKKINHGYASSTESSSSSSPEDSRRWHKKQLKNYGV